MTQWEVDEYDEKFFVLTILMVLSVSILERVVRNALRHMKVTWKGSMY